MNDVMFQEPIKKKETKDLSDKKPVKMKEKRRSADCSFDESFLFEPIG